MAIVTLSPNRGKMRIVVDLAPCPDIISSILSIGEWLAHVMSGRVHTHCAWDHARSTGSAGRVLRCLHLCCFDVFTGLCPAARALSYSSLKPLTLLLWLPMTYGYFSKYVAKKNWIWDDQKTWVSVLCLEKKKWNRVGVAPSHVVALSKSALAQRCPGWQPRRSQHGSIFTSNKMERNDLGRVWTRQTPPWNTPSKAQLPKTVGGSMVQKQLKCFFLGDAWRFDKPHRATHIQKYFQHVIGCQVRMNWPDPKATLNGIRPFQGLCDRPYGRKLQRNVKFLSIRYKRCKEQGLTHSVKRKISGSLTAIYMWARFISTYSMSLSHFKGLACATVVRNRTQLGFN